ncbi:MAG: RNA polymerase sigma factor [Mariprofundaceae bacterium]
METSREGPGLDTTQALERFLADVERRALRMAEIRMGHREDALDVVQEAMMNLVRRYAGRTPEEWTPLFYRILHNAIRDRQRRNHVRLRWRSFLGQSDEEDGPDPLENLPDQDRHGPERLASLAGATSRLVEALQNLPARQNEAFMLRAWEGLDVKQTAHAMGCSDGSVKTHYSRAVHALREQLEDHWP